MKSRPPSREALQKAKNASIPDVLDFNLKILFCGINPGLYTAATGHHFGRPGNRFWRALFESGLTPRLFHPSEQKALMPIGIGITNLVNRATGTAQELSRVELVQGSTVLTEKVLKFRPKCLTVLGIEAYRVSFGRPRSTIGMQRETIGTTKICLLPNPSGLNAHYTLRDFADLFSALRKTFYT